MQPNKLRSNTPKDVALVSPSSCRIASAVVLVRFLERDVVFATFGDTVTLVPVHKYTQH